ncbi:MAG: STN domain-containing protein, partial [Muribaculaceae bacterium]|nr:STN domain-containing protein [Muribaculaceae bacterium]
MMRRTIVLLLTLSVAGMSALAQNVTIKATDQPAATVFRSIIEQTGKNFVYSSELLKGVKISVTANNEPLKKVLTDMFRNTDIEYQIKGKNVILKRRKNPKPISIQKKTVIKKPVTQPDVSQMLDEVVVVSRLEAPTVETAEIGAKKITADDVRNTPT